MKKFIAASAALAIVLTGAPQAAAFSSMSSSSPAISKPAPTPNPTSPSRAEVQQALFSGHSTSLKNRGYEWSRPASELLQTLAQSSDATKPYIKADLEARGWTVEEIKHKTADFKQDYDALMATPVESKNYAFYGVYIEYGREVSTAYVLTTPIP